MRLDVVAENPLEALAGALGLLPASVVRVVWGFTVARALLAAIELGLFEALAEGPRDSAELATALGCDAEGARTLLRALSGFGLLRRRGERFWLRREAARYLTGQRGSDMSDALRMGALLDDRLRGLAESVRSGARQDFHAQLQGEEWRSYLRGLGSIAGITTKEVARAIKLAAPRRMLDVGGGHGRFSVALCQRYPALEAELLDLPGAVEVARELVAESEVAARITCRAGDLRAVEWGAGFDLVLLFNVLHNLPEADARQAVERAFAALAPGGTLAVLEGQHAGRAGDLSFQEAFGELFFYVLSASQTWPEPVLRAWMEQAGFGAIKRRRLLSLPGAALLLGRRPAA